MHRGPDPLEVEITGLAQGGEGVGRLEGKVVFVRSAFPGDVVRGEALESRGAFSRARLMEVLRPSPDRRDPPCPFVERCGGCPWMGMSEEAQLRSKQALVHDALARIGKLEGDWLQPIVASPRATGYRSRVRMAVRGKALGYRAPRSRDVVDIPHCLVLSPGVQSLVECVRRGVDRWGPFADELQVELAEDRGNAFVAVSGRGARHFATAGTFPPEVHLEVDSGPLGSRSHRLLPFLQANPLQNLRLVQAVVEGVSAPSVHGVLDLFCGSGNFGGPLLDAGLEVTGVESDPRAVAQARVRLPPPSRVMEGDAGAVVQRLVTGGARFDAVVLNPPRDGARDVCRQLKALGPRRVAYVSCDPVTLARDLRFLVDDGFAIRQVLPFDMMPQTSQVETVALLEGP